MRRGLLALQLGTLLLVPMHAGGQPDETLPVRVSVTALTTVLTATDVLTARFTIFNESDQPLREVSARVRIGPQVRTRSDVAIRAERPLREGQRYPVDASQRPSLADLAAGAQADLVLSVPATSIELGVGNEVRQLAIEVLARVDGEAQLVGRADSFVVSWREPATRSRLGWLWPIAAPTYRLIGDTFASENLADSLAGGALDVLLDVGASSGVPVTWAVDPEVLRAARAMGDSNSYTVRAPDGERRKGNGQAAAGRWLEQATRTFSASGASVLALPFGDPDVAALLHARRPDPLTRALARAEQSLALTVPGARTVAGLGWPPDGLVDSPTLRRYVASGISTLVLSSAGLPMVDEVTFTPTAPQRLTVDDQPVTALVADDTLSSVVAAGTATLGPTLALQRFVAETALLTMERPGSGRVVVVTPPRAWNPDRDYAAGLLRLTTTLPWLQPVSLSGLVVDPDSAVPRRLEYPRTARAAELPAGGYLARLQAAQVRLDRLTAILPEPEGTIPPLADALERAASVHFRGRPADGEQLVAELTRALGEHFGRLHVSTGGVVTLTSREGRIPVTIVNDLGTPVRVRIVVESTRLQVDAGDSLTPRDIPPGTFTFEVRARAQTSGLFPISVRVLTPDERGDEVLPTATLRVRSTAYGRVALITTGSAFLLLVIASATRLARRRTASRRTATV